MGHRVAWVVWIELLAGVLCAGASTARADESTTAPARVRVTAPSASKQRLTGDLVSLDDSVLVLRRAGQEAADRIPVVSITSIERRVRPSRKRRGVAIGFLAGAAVGAVVGYAGGDDCDRGGYIVCFDRSTTAAGGAIAFGLLGMAVGAVVAPGEKWEATTAERLRLAAGPLPAGGFGARLTLRF